MLLSLCCVSHVTVDVLHCTQVTCQCSESPLSAVLSVVSLLCFTPLKASNMNNNIMHLHHPQLTSEYLANTVSCNEESYVWKTRILYVENSSYGKNFPFFLQKAIKERNIDLSDIEANILGTDNEKQPPLEK